MGTMVQTMISAPETADRAAFADPGAVPFSAAVRATLAGRGSHDRGLAREISSPRAHAADAPAIAPIARPASGAREAAPATSAASVAGLAYHLSGQPDFHALYRYWREKRGSRSMPRRSDIDVLDLKQWIGRIALVEVEHEPIVLRYRLFGTTIAGELGCDPSGERIDPGRPETLPEPWESYLDAVRVGTPVFHAYDTESGTICHHLHCLVLPLSESGEKVDRLLVAFHAVRRLHLAAEDGRAVPGRGSRTVRFRLC